jgi:hypothetical protein
MTLFAAGFFLASCLCLVLALNESDKRNVYKQNRVAGSRLATRTPEKKDADSNGEQGE